jgi:hypothetical protein
MAFFFFLIKTNKYWVDYEKKIIFASANQEVDM